MGAILILIIILFLVEIVYEPRLDIITNRKGKKSLILWFNNNDVRDYLILF